MPVHPRSYSIAASAILLVGIVAGLRGFLQPAADSGATDSRPQSERKANESRILTNRRPEPDKATAARLLELERLKGRWMMVQDQAKTYNITSEHRALATESAESLLCSRELLKLLEYLDARGMANFSDQVRESVDKLFASSLAPEARQMLAGLSHNSNEHIRFILHGWSLRAGISCSKEEFEAFHASLGNEECKLSASLGWNVQLAASHPVDAMTSVLQMLDSGVVSASKHQILFRLVDNISPGADMAEIEQLLPSFNSDRSTYQIEEGRQRLLTKWAAVDPEAAVNHVLEFPGRADPKVMGAMLDTVLRSPNNRLSTMELLETIPEGPHFDHAARMAAERLVLSRPEDAIIYASMIGE